MDHFGAGGIRRGAALLEAHEPRDPKATLRTCLQRLALESRDEEPEDAEGVTLMTIHAAKGLEFPVVFIIGFEEDLLPVSGIQGEARDLEEERRLAYVGITRTRELLWVTRVASRTRRGRLETRTPSRFLEDFPDEAQVRPMSGTTRGHDPGTTRGTTRRHDPESGASVGRPPLAPPQVLRALSARLGGDGHPRRPGAAPGGLGTGGLASGTGRAQGGRPAPGGAIDR